MNENLGFNLENQTMKRCATTLIIAASLFLAAAADTALAQDCDRNYRGPDGGSWHDPDNWLEIQVPESTHDVCIRDGFEVLVHDKVCDAGSNLGEGCWDSSECPGATCVATQAAAAAVIVESSGKITLHAAAKLTLFSPAIVSRLDGEMFFDPASELLLADAVTIVGTGGTIRAKCRQMEEAFIKEAPGSTTGKLILEGGHQCTGGDNDGTACSKDGHCTGGGTCAASGAPNARADSLVLSGQFAGDEPFTIDLVNNAYVVGNAELKLWLTGDFVSGNGYWITEPINQPPLCVWPGGMWLDTAVEGSGTWVIEYGGFILVKSACTDLTGDVDINAHLDVDADFTTTGSLIMDYGGAKITVASGKKAQFD